MKSWLGYGQLAQQLHGKKSRAGYTIIEVLVVLAVTMGLLMAAMLSFQGKQGQTEFTDGVRNYEARLQTVMTDVQNGNYYNSAGNTGSHPDSIFLGKAIASDGATSHILTVMGSRTTGTLLDEVQNMVDANPVIDPGVQDEYEHRFGLEVRRIVRGDGSAQVGAFGFFNPFSGSDVTAASRLVLLYGVPNTIVPINALNATSDIQAPGKLVRLDDGIIICLAGQNDQHAEIKIGTENSQTTIFSTLNTSVTTPGACNGS